MTESGLTLLKNIGDKIETSTYNGILNLQDPLLLLLITLAIIGVCSEFDMFFNSTWNWGNIFTKIIHIGFLAFLIKNWDNLLKIVKNSGQTLGMAAGGVDVTFTPTYLLASTCSKVYLAFENLWKNFPGVMSGTIMVHILATIALCVALLALFRIAFVIFMANAEFLILGSLSMVLLPFGVTRWTSSICEKTWGILLTCAVKLMVAVFMVCLVGNEIDDAFNVSSSITNETVSGFITSACCLLFLSYLTAQAVEFAGAMTTGASFATNSIVHASASATRRTASTGMAAGGFLWGLTGLSETSKIRKSQQAQAETIQKIAEKVGVKFDKPNKKTGNSSWWNRK